VSLEHPIGTIAVVLAFMVAGSIAMLGLPVNLMPDIVYPMVRVQVAAAQMPPEILLNTVTRVLEQELVQAEQLETMESTTEQGQVQITLSFAVDRDVDDALKDVSTWVDRAKSKLPANLEPPIIFKFDPQNLPVAEFVLSSDTMDITRLPEFAEYDLAYRFIGVPGVSGIRVAGGRVREIQVRVAPEKLRAHGLTMQDLAETISASNVQTPAGRVDALGRELAGQVQSLFRTPAEIGGVQVRASNGESVEIRHLAEVADTHREQRLIVTVNGKEGVKLSAFKIPEANSVEVADAIRQRLSALEQDRVIPSDVSLATTADESVYINQSIASANHALALAIALVAVTVLLFLKDWKFTLVSIAVLPVAIVITALLMRVFGLSFNLMSIGGLIVGVGAAG
jgi:multidrug efflux pump subunit AcrB